MRVCRYAEQLFLQLAANNSGEFHRFRLLHMHLEQCPICAPSYSEHPFPAQSST